MKEEKDRVDDVAHAYHGVAERAGERGSALQMCGLSHGTVSRKASATDEPQIIDCCCTSELLKQHEESNILSRHASECRSDVMAMIVTIVAPPFVDHQSGEFLISCCGRESGLSVR